MNPKAKRVLETLYPESRLSGFARNDHRVLFFTLIHSVLRPEMNVLDYGAGRGKWAELETGYKRALTTLKGRCARLTGCDIDPAVRDNPLIDEAVVIEHDAPLPFPDAHFDIITSWAVLEHVDNPAAAAAEIARVLKPGGVFFAWTPNKWGYVGIGARLIPNRFHARMLRGLDTGGRRGEDVFPTRYRINTVGAVSRYFPADDFENLSFIHTGPPAYHGGNLLLARFWRLYNALVPPALGQSLFVVARKR